jgi:hypothetical protein
VHASSGVRHVAVDAAGGEEDAIDLRVDADGARTVVPVGEMPAFRVTAAGGWIHLRGGGLERGRTLWPVPGGRRAGAGGAVMIAGARAAAQEGTRTRDGVARPGGAVAGEPLDLRAAARDEGGAVIALRQPAALWLGLVDGRLAAEGPLVALSRPRAVIGMPAVAPWGTGGVVAWAERPAGDRDWQVMVASWGESHDAGGIRTGSVAATAGAPAAPSVRVVAAGMSPSLAMLPDGDLLLAYAVGVSGSHRVVVRRLRHDLEPRGEPLVVSPEEINAGQPAAAVAPGGRALVAFFGAQPGRPSSVLATPLVCAAGM